MEQNWRVVWKSNIVKIKKSVNQKRTFDISLDQAAQSQLEAEF